MSGAVFLLTKRYGMRHQYEKDEWKFWIPENIKAD